ncbi:hypothetical protein AHAS_Ahas10G0154900 [Arachis hypogaea]
MFTAYTWFNYGSVETRNEFNVFLSLKTYSKMTMCVKFLMKTLPKNNSNNLKNLGCHNNQNKKHLLMSDLWNSNNSPAKNQQRSNPNKNHLLMCKFYCLYKYR